MTCRSHSSVNLGDFTGLGCSCFPYPSCVLFPRRADGKVILPNPLHLLKDDRLITPRYGRPKRYSTIRHRASPHPMASSERLSCQYEDHTSPINDDKPHVPADWKDATPLPSEQVQRVSYDELRSFPEFKAFKLNQDGKLQTRRRAKTTTAASILKSTDKSKGREGMEEIRVTRRTKRQAYVRSGTHDFSIHFYNMDQKVD